MSDQTDLARWRDLENFLPEWDRRAETASRWIQPGETVLDLGCGRMSLERYLPPDCTYIPCDLFARDQRTIICNLNNEAVPSVSGITTITALGVSEYIIDLARFYQSVRRLGVRFINSYHPLLKAHPLDRPANGWVNSLTLGDWMQLAERCDFRVQEMKAMNPVQYLAAFQPDL